VLMWEGGCSLHKLHQSKVTPDGRRAYHANTQKTLRWILGLFVHAKAGLGVITGEAEAARSQSNSNSMQLMLKWCLAMLLPRAKDRITAEELVKIVQAADLWVVQEERERKLAESCARDRDGEVPASTSASSPFWIGTCCKSQSLTLTTLTPGIPSIFTPPWPSNEASLDQVLDGEGCLDCTWDAAAQGLNFGPWAVN
jgi:hypothetical protein